MSSCDVLDVCKVCGGKALGYYDTSERYMSLTCLDEDCRHFFSKCDGEVEVDCELDYEEWSEKVED